MVAAFQPGVEGLHEGRAWVAPFSIPDHVGLDGVGFWYPGSKADRPKGIYDFLPPADNEFFFVQMVHEQWRLSHSLDFSDSERGQQRMALT